MTKQEFLYQLKKKLSGLPKSEAEERIAFYGEMVDDRIEEGISEEEAVSIIGPVEKVAAEIISSIPFSKICKDRIKAKKKINAWEIVLIALGSPIWLSLAVSIIAVIISFYAVLWSLIISLYAIFASIIGCVIGGVIYFFLSLFIGKSFSGFAVLGASIFLIGFAMMFFIACKEATKGSLFLTKKITLVIKKSFIKREEV